MFVQDSKFSVCRNFQEISFIVMYLMMVFLFKYIRQIFLEGIRASLVVFMSFFVFWLVFVMIMDRFGID